MPDTLRPYSRKMLTFSARRVLQDWERRSKEAGLSDAEVVAGYLRAQQEARSRGKNFINATDARNALGLPHPPQRDD